MASSGRGSETGAGIGPDQRASAIRAAGDLTPVGAGALDERRRRALYRAMHRGTKEMDWLLGRYALAHLASMDDANLDLFEKLMAMPDPDLQRWIFDPELAQGSEFIVFIDAIRDFHGLEA